MRIFDKFPFSNAHELNLDWILRQLKDLLRRVKILEQSGGGGGGGGTSDYNDLSNKPSINGVPLIGNKTMIQLKLDEIYWASYGSTTYAEITTALNTGKLPVCYFSGQYYIYSERSGSSRYFVTSSGSQLCWVTVNSANTWGNYTSPVIPGAATNAPQMDGSAAVGSSSKYAKEDHVHPSDTNKISAPASPASGDYLKWNGSAWIADSLPIYNGGIG